MLYGIHLWAELDRDLLVGGSRPNQNHYVLFVIPVMHQVLYRDDGSPRFRRQTVKVEVKTGAIVKNSGILQCGRSQIQNSIFSRFRGTFRLSCTQPTGNSFTPNQWYWLKVKTLKVCLLLVWRVCDQAFGRYRPLNVAEKWSSDHHENWKFANTHVEKFIDSKKYYSFRSMTNKLMRLKSPYYMRPWHVNKTKDTARPQGWRKHVTDVLK